MEFFTFSKLLSSVTQPMTWVALLLILAFLGFYRWPKASRRLLGLAIASIALLGFEKPPAMLLSMLEGQHPPLAIQDTQSYRGVVVLGGATAHPSIYQETSQIPTGEAGERMSEAAALMLQHPDWKLIFAGGEGRLLKTGVAEADLALVYFERFGIEASRIILEGGSRNTRENAANVAKLLGDDCDKKWLLITSAFHMPRSVTQFNRLGCDLTPYPVDFRAHSQVGWSDYSLASSLLKWQTVLHEFLGLVVYQLISVK